MAGLTQTGRGHEVAEAVQQLAAKHDELCSREITRITEQCRRHPGFLRDLHSTPAETGASKADDRIRHNAALGMDKPLSPGIILNGNMRKELHRTVAKAATWLKGLEDAEGYIDSKILPGLTKEAQAHERRLGLAPGQLTLLARLGGSPIATMLIEGGEQIKMSERASRTAALQEQEQFIANLAGGIGQKFEFIQLDEELTQRLQASLDAVYRRELAKAFPGVKAHTAPTPELPKPQFMSDEVARRLINLTFGDGLEQLFPDAGASGAPAPGAGTAARLAGAAARMASAAAASQSAAEKTVQEHGADTPEAAPPATPALPAPEKSVLGSFTANEREREAARMTQPSGLPPRP